MQTKRLATAAVRWAKRHAPRFHQLQPLIDGYAPEDLGFADSKKKHLASEVAISAFLIDTASFSKDLYDDGITLEEWRRKMRDSIKLLYTAQYVLGRSGNWSHMTKRDWGLSRNQRAAEVPQQVVQRAQGERPADR